MFAGCAAYMFWKESHKGRHDYLMLTSVLAVAAIILFVVFKKRMWSLADEVLDGGTYFIVRSGARNVTINLENITNVEAEGGFGATTVRFRLAIPCELGDVVSFLAKSTSRNPFAVNTIVEDLMSRVNRAHSVKAI